MRNSLLIVVFLCLSRLTAFAQHEADNWYFGDHAGISFQNGTVNPIGDGQMVAFEGCATISDKVTGALLFYTDGFTVWNSNHQVMKNGIGLKGGVSSTKIGTSSTQSSLIVPNPANNLQYYIFTVSEFELGPSDLFYSVVSLEAPDGEVISKNNFLLGGLSEKLTGTLDCSGAGFWVVTHHNTNSIFYSFHVTTSGVNPTPITSVYSTDVIEYSGGYIKISPNRSKLALVAHSVSRISLFDFDSSTGSISNYMLINDQISRAYYGVSFSPDNSKLYVTGAINPITLLRDRTTLLQYEINLPDAASIRNSLFTLNTGLQSGALQLAPNGKIYIAFYNTKLIGVIDNPNRKDSACNYQMSGAALVGDCQNGLPNFMDYNFGHSADTVTFCNGIGGSKQIGSKPIAGFSYSWTPVIGLDNPTISNPIASPTQTTVYRLKVKSATGCESIQTFEVIIDTIKPKVISVSPICKGSSVQLSASGGDTYVWSPAMSLDTATKAEPIASPKVSTRYKVIVKRGDCMDSAFINVEVISPHPTAGQDKIICTGSSVQIGDTASKPSESYTWTPTDGLNITTIPNPIASPTRTTKYILEVYNNGCTAYDTVLVTVIPNTRAIVSKDTSICRGASVQLTASGGSTYSWFPLASVNNPAISNPIASPNITTKYKVVVSNGNCIDSAFVTVTVTAFSGANAGIDKTVCPGATSELGAPSQVGSIYLWEPITGLDDANKANPSVTPSATTQYILKVTNAAGCSAFDTVLVTVGNIVAKASSDSSICSGSSVQLLASGGSDYEWSPSTGLDNPNIPNPVATPSITTTYKVRVSSGSTCEDFASVTVTVNPFPIADAGKDQQSCKGETFLLGAQPLVGNTYSWQPITGLDDPTKSNPLATPSATTQYILTVTNSTGCSAKDTVVVTVGNIKAVVSNDTSVCAGISIRLSANGGSNYAWSPIEGLDNPSSATPICTVNSTTKYKVVVTSGFCIDSAFVTVSIAPSPIADAGLDKTICMGENVQIGNRSVNGNTYSWIPTTGLSNPVESAPIASPDVTTEYILTVTNSTGCISKDSVKVTINQRTEYTFTLNPSVITILPGGQFQTSLSIPSGVQSWKVHLDYDNLIVKFTGITQMTNGINATAIEKNGTLTVSGTGENGNVIMTFNSFLPYTTDTTFAMRLTVDSASMLPCESVSSKGNILTLGEFCGRRIRTVRSTGKNYFLTSKENGVNFGVGLSGNVRLELYDYTGTLKEVLSDGIMEAGEYTLDFDVPTGVYFCRISAGMYNEVQKVVIVQ